MPRLTPGTRLSTRFETIRLLGIGGMGEVWLARDHEDGVDVALKVLRPDRTGGTAPEEMLKREYHQAQRLVHPGIVRVFGLHRAGDLHFISMEYLPGGDLRQMRGRPWDGLVDLILPVTEALGYAHRLGVIHRDIKTTNILLDAQGRPVITDFGIATTTDYAPAPGSFPGGSVSVMSPQQLNGEPPHPTDDIYGLGAVCHELLSGAPPFPSQARDRADEHQEPPPLITPSTLPIMLSDLVRRMLAPAREDRPQDMEEVAHALKELPRAPRRPPAGAPHVGSIPEYGQRTRPPGEPVEIRPPDSEPSAVSLPPLWNIPDTLPPSDTAPPRTRHSWIRGMLAGTLAILVAAAVGVFLVLPRAVEEGNIDLVSVGRDIVAPKPIPAEVKSSAPAAPPRPRMRESGAEREAAEQALAAFLNHNQRLQDLGAAAWGGEDYARALALASQGDKAFGHHEFSAAQQAYSQGDRLLETLATQREQWLEEALSRGKRALEAGDPRTATARFQRALELSPDNPVAAGALERAAQLEQAQGLVRAAHDAAVEGRLEVARERYQDALKLSPELNSARQGLAEVETGIEDRRFQQTMSRGLAALLARNLDLAQRELEQARKLRPQAPEVHDALKQLTHERQQGRLITLRREARRLVKAQQWSQAAKRYQEILDIDPNLAFASTGRDRALERARIDTRMNGYLRDPLRLSATRVHESAQALLDETGRIPDPGPRLESQRQKLKQLLAAASTPVSVPFTSDGLTEVTIYRIGSLGRFRNRTLKLRPGHYIVVGSRPGYRDVRHSITVTPGRKIAPIAVRCQERI